MRRIRPEAAWVQAASRSSLRLDGTPFLALPFRSRVPASWCRWWTSSPASTGGSGGDQEDSWKEDDELPEPEQKQQERRPKPRSLFQQTRRVEESELQEKFIKGGGPGGQKVNKSNNCVYLKHIPTGLEVKCQEQRELVRNRTIARKILHEKLMLLYFPEESKTAKRQEKIRRRKERMGRRYGRSDSFTAAAADPTPTADLRVGASTTAELQQPEDEQTARAPATATAATPSAAGPKKTTSSPRGNKAPLEPVGGRVRRRVDPVGLPDFVFQQLGVQRSQVVECVDIDPEEFEGEETEEEDDDEDDEDEEGSDNEEDEGNQDETSTDEQSQGGRKQ